MQMPLFKMLALIQNNYKLSFKISKTLPTDF